ncbi:MAG: hypothetical protein ACLUNS_10200 [Alistipes shahii]
MEDFASVIWVIIIVGAMIFNVVSQSRKARGKGAKQIPPRARHGPRPHPDMPTPSTAPVRPEPITSVFPDECQSLEEIPAQEYEPEYAALKTTETEALRHQTTDRLKTAHETDEIAAHAIDAPEESSSSIAGEFNLRQAVIYSEILKPRFDEE